MTRKRFQKLNRALLVRYGKDTKEAGLIRMLCSAKNMPKDGLSYEEDWYMLNLLGFNPYGVGVKRK